MIRSGEYQVARPSCPRCRWPMVRCFCDSIRPFATTSRFLILMHPHEARHERTGTGRLTHLVLESSEILVGEGFANNERLDGLLADLQWQPVLLWPDASAQALVPGSLDSGRRFLFIILDGSWSQARSMFRHSPQIQGLPRIRLNIAAPIGWRFKKQPAPHCLSTLETIHQLLLDLDSAGIEAYPDPAQLPQLFEKLQLAQTRFAPPAN